MLHRITWKQFVTWMAFDELDPIGGQRLDNLFASVVSTLVNLRRNVEKHPDPFPLSDFILKWGRGKAKVKAPPKPTGKSWQEMKLMGMMLAAMYNAAEDADAKKKARRRSKKG